MGEVSLENLQENFILYYTEQTGHIPFKILLKLLLILYLFSIIHRVKPLKCIKICILYLFHYCAWSASQLNLVPVSTHQKTLLHNHLFIVFEALFML